MVKRVSDVLKDPKRVAELFSLTTRMQVEFAQRLYDQFFNTGNQGSWARRFIDDLNERCKRWNLCS
jgi:hypothetical protein